MKGNPTIYENVPMWHYRSPNQKEYKNALKQIERYEKRF